MPRLSAIVMIVRSSETAPAQRDGSCESYCLLCADGRLWPDTMLAYSLASLRYAPVRLIAEVGGHVLVVVILGGTLLTMLFGTQTV